MNANVVFPKAVLEFTIFACTALPRLIAAYRELTEWRPIESAPKDVPQWHDAPPPDGTWCVVAINEGGNTREQYQRWMAGIFLDGDSVNHHMIPFTDGPCRWLYPLPPPTQEGQ